MVTKVTQNINCVQLLIFEQNQNIIFFSNSTVLCGFCIFSAPAFST